MCAMRRPARWRCATSSRSSPISNSAASPSATTATSPIPTSCAGSSCAAAACSNRPATPRSSSISSRPASRTSVEERMIDALRQVRAPIRSRRCRRRVSIGVRDPLGVRPLVLGQARRCLDRRVGDLRARHHRRRFRARCRCRRDDHRRPAAACARRSPSIARKQAALHLRIHLFRAARQRRRRHQRLRDAEAHRRRARAREPCAGRHRHPGAGFGRAGGDRLCRGMRSCPSSSASSAITMSAAPSSSRPTRSAISA